MNADETEQHQLAAKARAAAAVRLCFGDGDRTGSQRVGNVALHWWSLPTAAEPTLSIEQWLDGDEWPRLARVDVHALTA